MDCFLIGIVIYENGIETKHCIETTKKRFNTIKESDIIEVANESLQEYSPYLVPYKESYIELDTFPDNIPKWGFCNRKKKVVIPFLYEDALHFTEKIAAVKFRGKWGFIDRAGNEVIPFVYQDAYFFNKGIALVRLNNKWGFIDKTQKTIIPFICEEVEGFFGDNLRINDDFIQVNLNKNSYKKIITSEEFEWIDIPPKWVLFDRTGVQITKRHYSIIEKLEDVLFLVNIGGKLIEDPQYSGKWGLINKYGIELATCKYSNKFFYKSNLAIVNIGGYYGPENLAADDFFYGGKWGVIDKNGNQIIDCLYDKIEIISDTIVFVNIGFHSPSYYDRCENDYAPVISGKWGVINLSYGEIVPCVYSEIQLLDNGMFKARNNLNFGLIDSNGNVKTPFLYENTFLFSEGLACVKFNNKYGYIDSNGNVKIPIIYEDSYSFSEGLACVKFNNKYGYVDPNGNVKIPIIYEDSYSFSEGLAFVKFNNKYGYIDSNGNVKIPFIYEDSYSYSKGLACVKLNDKYGLIDKSNKVICPIIYNYFYIVDENLIINKINYKYGVTDFFGKKIIECEYDNIVYIKNGLFEAELEGLWIYFTKQGVKVIESTYPYDIEWQPKHIGRYSHSRCKVYIDLYHNIFINEERDEISIKNQITFIDNIARIHESIRFDGESFFNKYDVDEFWEINADPEDIDKYCFYQSYYIDTKGNKYCL